MTSTLCVMRLLATARKGAGWLALSMALLMPAHAPAEPGNCPKERGQIRFDGLSFTVKGGGRTYTLRGSLWDRDTNGVPSNGDLFRADDVLVNGRDAAADQMWFVVKGGLAKTVAKRFKGQGDGLSATCETRFVVEGVPTFRSGSKLAGYLRKMVGGQQEVSRYDLARGEMSAWAKEICKGSRHVGHDELTDRLIRRASPKYPRLDRRRVRGVAAEVARDHEVACARLDPGVLTP